MTEYLEEVKTFPVEWETNETPSRKVILLGRSGIDPDIYVANLAGVDGKVGVMTYSGSIIGSNPPVKALPTTEGVTHTPGPWYWRDVEGMRTLAPGVLILGDGIGCGGPWGDEIDRRNARLIAAAPDLLSSLSAFLKMYLQGANSGDWGNWDPEQEPEIIAVRAAIAKTLSPTHQDNRT